DVQVRDNSGSSLMTEAARRGALEMGQILAESGASLTVDNLENRTPLHFAAEEGHREFVQWLLEQGSSEVVENKDVKGKTALQLAIEGKGDLSLVKMLIDHGADVKTVDSDTNTLLTSAAIHNKLDVARYLVEK